MRRFLPCVLTAVCLAVVSSASAQTEPPPDPLADWVDACHATKPDIQALLEHNALMISEDALTENPSGTWSLNVQPFTQYVRPLEPSPYVLDLCPQARFYGQPQVINGLPHADDITRRSAVQVGPDLVLTTWHNPFAPSQPGWYKVVFGLHARTVGGDCIPPDFENIPASQVYDVEAVVADGWPLDMLLLRLDRVVSDHYPRVRRSGRGWPGDAMTGIGHPQRLAAKVDRAAKAGPTTIVDEMEWLGVENINLLPDSSGSMVYNRSQRVLETVAKQGGGPTLEWLPAQACLMFGHREGFTGLNASLRYFAEHIPAFELLAELDPVVHVAPVGGTVSNPPNRAVWAPTTATGSIAYAIIPPAPPGPDEPTLAITPLAPYVGSLPPGQGFEVQEHVSIQGVSTCGRRERGYEIRDTTHGFVDLARHVFEIGIREFGVTPAFGSQIEDLALPLDGNSVYYLSNPRPDPVTVRITADQPWVTVGVLGGPGGGPTLDVTLQPHELAKAIVLGVSFPAEPQYLYPYISYVTFDFAPGTPCPASGPTTRRLTFLYGRETFKMTGPVVIPDSTLSSAVVTLDAPEDFCVEDVNAIVRTSGVQGKELRVRLVSPEEVRRQLFDRDQSVVLPLDVWFDDEASGTGSMIPLNSLDVFDHRPGGGTWRFIVEDWVAGTQGALDEWGLTFEACPEP